MYLTTARVPWVSLRSAVVADDTDLSAFGWDDWPSANTLSLSAPPLEYANGIGVSFYGTDTADYTAEYHMYGRSRTNGPIMLLQTGIFTLGTQALALDPVDKKTTIANALWADTITVTGGIYSDATEILDSANNRQAILMFDQRIIEDLYCQIDLNGGSGTDIVSAYACVAGY